MNPVLTYNNGTLTIDNTPLQTRALAETYLTAATTGGTSSTLTVPNILGFAINQVLLIEDIGTESAEIVLTHGSTTPSITANVGTITLTAALVKTHPVGSRVRVIQYNQIELSNGTTATGSKTTLTVATTANFNPPSSLGSGLIAVDPTLKVQTGKTTEYTTGYFFARYKNSITSAFSSYNDALVYTGWAESTVGYMIEQALSDLGMTLSARVTREKCYGWVNECLRLVQGKQVRWPEHFSYNAAIGQLSRGTNVLSMPSDIYDTETNRSLINVRTINQDLTYLDPLRFKEFMGQACVTQVRTAASAGDTSLAVDNSYDFADSGTIHLYKSGTQYEITYTGITRDTATGATAAFTGIPSSGDGAMTVSFAVDTYVWQAEAEGNPVAYTVRNGNIEVYPLADGNQDNLNLYGDYGTVATAVNSDGDTIDFHRYDMVSWYLKWRIKMAARTDGNLDRNDTNFLMHKEALNDAIRTSPSTIDFKRDPHINTMNHIPAFPPSPVTSTTDTTTSSTLVFYSETPSGLVNSSNTTYTTAHDIDTVFSFAINGTFIHPSDYSYSGSTITMDSALDISLAGTPFTIVYSPA